MEFKASFTFEDLVGRAPAFLACLEKAWRIAQTDLPALITGESGTGKEMLAQAIHNASARRASLFVGINVAAMPHEQFGAELYHYESGPSTQTGASGVLGKLGLAEEGTLLLDGIGDLSLPMQTKLLRLLEEQERQAIERGGAGSVPVGTRLIATTDRNLETAVETGAFRLDLYHRLRVIDLRVPPLRERLEDVPVLVDHYARLHCARMGRPPVRVSQVVLQDLQRYHWPGNVRELANLVAAKVALLEQDRQILEETPSLVLRDLHRKTRDGAPVAEIVPLADLERSAVEHALKTFDGKVTKVAKALGVSKGTIYNKIKRYGLEGSQTQD